MYIRTTLSILKVIYNIFLSKQGIVNNKTVLQTNPLWISVKVVLFLKNIKKHIYITINVLKFVTPNIAQMPHKLYNISIELLFLCSNFVFTQHTYNIIERFHLIWAQSRLVMFHLHLSIIIAQSKFHVNIYSVKMNLISFVRLSNILIFFHNFHNFHNLIFLSFMSVGLSTSQTIS